jgi:hypothetical protein
MQSLCNQSVTRKLSWSVGRVAGVMINALLLPFQLRFPHAGMEPNGFCR